MVLEVVNRRWKTCFALNLYIYNQAIMHDWPELWEFFCLYFFKIIFSLLNYNKVPFCFVNECAPPRLLISYPIILRGSFQKRSYFLKQSVLNCNWMKEPLGTTGPLVAFPRCETWTSRFSFWKQLNLDYLLLCAILFVLFV